MREQVVAGNQGAKFSRPDFAASGWYPTTVPTTAMGVLVRQGIYPDPYVGVNMMHIPDADDDHNKRYDLSKFSHLPDHANPWSKPYWFRTNFTVPQNYENRTVLLHFDGINYRADVWVNGEQIAAAEQMVGMFRRFSFDVTREIKPGHTNAVAVQIHPLDVPGDPVEEQLGGLGGGFGPNGGDGKILQNVTDYCTVGWDWLPAVRDRNMGIWQHVWLEATGAVTVRDPAAFTNVSLPGAAQARVTIRGYLENATSAPVATKVTTRLAPEGFEDQAIAFDTIIKVPPGKSEFILKPGDHPELTMENPHLWWPVGYGRPDLYELTITASVDGKVTGKASSLVGVRSVATTINASGGRVFMINGRLIRITGGAWVPDLLMSWSAQRYRDEVRLLAEGNHTLVRVNGCGIMPPDCFFDECDRRGIMVWEDFSRTSAGKRMQAADLKLLLDSAKDCIGRMRGHASLIVWCGANEWVPQADFGEAMQNEILPAMDGTRFYLVSSSKDDAYEKERNAVWTGGPWYLLPLAEYFHRYAKGHDFAFKDEIGLAAPPPINTVARFMADDVQPDAAAFPLGVTSGFHDATGNHFRVTDAAIHKSFGASSSLADYLWEGDLFTNRAHRAIYEASNKYRPINAGTLLWKVNAAWPSYLWQVFDWTLHLNGGYYAMKNACEPLHVQESEDDQGIQVVSTLAEPRNGLIVKIGVRDLQGKLEHQENRAVDALADVTTPVGTVTSMINDGNLHFLSLDLVDRAGSLLSHQVKWVQQHEAWGDLAKVNVAAVNARITGTRTEGRETVYAVEVTNTSAFPAVEVYLELLAGAEGQEVLPSFWSDNALTLIPGEKRPVVLKFRTALLQGKPAHFMVEGFNVTPLEINVSDGKATTPELKLSEAKLDSSTHRITATAKAAGTVGNRLTTWPVEVKVDGQFNRTIRVAANSAPATFYLACDRWRDNHSIVIGSLDPIRMTRSRILCRLISEGGPKLSAPKFDLFAGDPVFVVGRSDPAKDWPTVQPGPLDLWAGGTPHTYALSFDLEKATGAESGNLVISLFDAHAVHPPGLLIEINGCKIERSVTSGKDSTIVAPFPPGTLHQGINQIKVTSRSGSWMVYRDLWLECLDAGASRQP